MPLHRIVASKRGKAAVLGAAAFAVSSGWTAYMVTAPDSSVVAIHAAIDKGLTPPAVELAVTKLIKPWEGLVLHAHWDRYSHRYDICYGDTMINGKPVTAGMTKTPEECDAILKVRVTRDYYLPLVDGVKGYADAPDSVQAAMLSGAYNFGPVAQKHSGASRAVAKRQYHEACIAQTAFNKSNGHLVPGLVLRREMGDAQRIGEAELCVSGLS
jgi:lysozyme